MTIHTSRFGLIAITDDDIIHFPEGLLGFNELRKFVLLDDPSDEIFAWLQSCDEPGIAFPLLEPELLTANYSVQLTKHDMEILNLQTKEGIRSFSIITIPQDPTQMTANLKAPIVINVAKRLARQCVLQDNSLAIREPIFTRLQQRVVQNPSASIKNQSVYTGVAVKLNRPPEVEG
ncbi:MAG: flagellar assembly protein FliW [Bdellovibrionaceae bacterium]|nr:flagellar assembly protein FliW [Pseudobdellovibrionaceae bacterium]